MPSVQCLRHFFNERLTAAAEEIFSVVEKAIVEYEEEINRQRRLLSIVWEPQVKLHRTELPQKYVCKQEDVVADQQPCNQEKNSSLDQQDPEPPQIKEEQENLCVSKDEEQLVLKQEPDTCIQTLTNGKVDHSENETLYLNPNESQMAAEEKSLVSLLVNSSEISELNTNYQLLSHNSHFAGSLYHGGEKHGDSVSTGNAETKPQKRLHKSNNVHNPTMFKNYCNTLKGQKSFKCDTCEKAFPYNSKLIRHQRIHTGEKPYSCNVCGKQFNQQSILKVHKRIHTGERPHTCNVCGKSFNQSSILKAHKIIHTGEKPYGCDMCGKRFNQRSILKVHKRTHTGERPFACGICGKRFTQKSILDTHFRTHRGKTDTLMVTLTYEKGDPSEDPTLCFSTDGSQMAAGEESLGHISEIPEMNPDYQSLYHRGGKLGDSVSTGNEEAKPQKRHYKSNNIHNPAMLKIYYNTHTFQKSFKCDTCGKAFPFQSKLNRHLRVHTGERPYSCNICGKRFSQTSILKVHKRIHTGERPHSCNICGKSFNQKSILNVHKRIHTGERPYSCHICGKRFNQKSILDVHIRTHTGEKPYSCKTCGKRLRSNSSLLVHMKTHTYEEPYSCETWEISDLAVS